jgi:formate dehydrogenase major subunit
LIFKPSQPQPINYEAAANLLANGALDSVGKIPEFKYCAVAVKAGGQLAVSGGFFN